VQEEADLAAEEAKLLVAKDLHIRELKRILDEDRSRFNNNPILNGRVSVPTFSFSIPVMLFFPL
jgi:hypothetical protein